MTHRTLGNFMNEPIDFFDHSITEMHSIPRAELEALQTRGHGAPLRRAPRRASRCSGTSPTGSASRR